MRGAWISYISMCSVVLSGCGGEDAGGATTIAEDCQPAHENITTLEDGTLTVSLLNGMPYSGLKDNKLTGVDGEIMTAIAALECLEIKPQLVDGAAVIPSVTGGRADVGLGGWFITEERLKAGVVMTVPAYVAGNSFVSKEGISDVAELARHTVGAPAGYAYVPDLKKLLGGDLKEYDSALNMYNDLKAGRIDVAVDGAGVAAKIAPAGFQVEDPTGDLPDTLKPTDTGFPVNGDDAGLLEAINDDINELNKQGRIKTMLVDNGFPASSAVLAK